MISTIKKNINPKRIVSIEKICYLNVITELKFASRSAEFSRILGPDVCDNRTWENDFQLSQRYNTIIAYGAHSMHVPWQLFSSTCLASLRIGDETTPVTHAGSAKRHQCQLDVNCQERLTRYRHRQEIKFAARDHITVTAFEIGSCIAHKQYDGAAHNVTCLSGNHTLCSSVCGGRGGGLLRL